MGLIADLLSLLKEKPWISIELNILAKVSKKYFDSLSILSVHIYYMSYLSFFSFLQADLTSEYEILG